MIEDYVRYNRLMVSIHPIPLAEVSRYGILHGVWEDNDHSILNVSAMVEKPKASYAEEYLAVRNKKGEKEYYSVFGQYILTPEVFSQIHEDIMQKEIDGDHQTEIELTSALDAVRKRSGMVGVRLRGRMFDMGNPVALTNAITEFAKPK
jgi:UTP-glucose-1-phosphate uridylyltransferase